MPENEKSFAGSSLITFLSSLEKSELREFDKFIHSPFHNNRSDVSRYFDVLKKFHPQFTGSEFSKQHIFSLLYPGTSYKDDVLRRLSSNLLKAGEEFGAYITFRKDRFVYNKSLSAFYLSKSSQKLLARQINKTESDLLASPCRDAAFFLNMSFLEEYRRLGSVRKDSSGRKIDVQSQIDSTWKFAAITLFRLYKTASEHSRQFDTAYNLNNLELLFGLIERTGFMGSKALEIWYLVMKLQSNPDDNTFHRLKKTITANSNLFEPVEGFIIYVSLLGYCYEKNILPSENFHVEEYEIIREMLAGGLLIQDNVFHPEWFIYAVITSLRAGKMKFAGELLSDYAKLLPPGDSDNVLEHAFAEIEIEKGNYNKALKHLAVSKYNNIAEKLRAKHMYLKIYYEQGLSEQFFYSIDSFKHLIKNEVSLSKGTKQLRENFIKYAVKLFRIKLNESAEDPGAVKKEILKTPIMGNKWLLKKADELLSIHPAGKITRGKSIPRKK
ncbi:MAG: hypothetical protein IAE90_04505 [Ignavibacteria bacterium]|nr:hypothetical protein [Ignavibacteria bacterium]